MDELVDVVEAQKCQKHLSNTLIARNSLVVVVVVGVAKEEALARRSEDEF